MISAEELLKPISPEKPCGEDLYYDPSFQELETLMRGKPETQFSPAEDPNWKMLRDRCLDLLARSKDLRLATALSLAALKTDGLLAFREGLALLNGLLERYWDGVYPLLDPAENNDPTLRVNIIAALATPVGTYGDPMRVLERLQEAPLTNSIQMGRIALADMVRSETGTAAPDGKTPVSAAQIEAAFRDTKPEELQAINRAVADSAALVSGIDAFLTKTIGADKAPDLDLLPNELREIQKRLAPYLPAGAVPLPPPEPAGAAAAAGAVAGSKPISGEIQSRQDVVRMLDKICEFYKRHEPSSPVPYILRRAQRLADLDFMGIIDDLSPDSVKEIQRITGEKPKVDA
jgi:type VI secretion system protein ImpA